MQNYNSELVRCIEELREKREELNKSIAADEEEKGAPCARSCPSPAAGGARCAAAACEASPVANSAGASSDARTYLLLASRGPG